MRGQFNICVPVLAGMDGTITKKLFRCPIPHKVGGRHRADASDEKVRVEAANYAYVEANCPNIPIAGLIGFGFSNSLHNHLGFFDSAFHYAKHLLYSVWHRKALSRYAKRNARYRLGMPYLLLNFIEPWRGRILSDYWSPHCDNDDMRRENLYRGLSHLTISLARHPQSHIGGLRFNDDGSIRLLNPPFLCANAILENETGLRALDNIYISYERFLNDMLAFRDRVLQAQPNAANDEDDCRLQIAHTVLLRALMPQLVDFNSNTPFVLQFTDLHPSNLFVYEAWNITSFIGLAFMCSLPASMLSVPYWLAAESLDDLAACAEKHVRIHNALMKAFQREELSLGRPSTFSRTMQKSWSSGACWLHHCLTSVNALPSIVENHLYTMFGFCPSLREQQIFANWLSLFWSRRSPAFVAQKVADKEAYTDEVGVYFSSVNSANTLSGS